MPTEEDITNALRKCEDPEIGENIVDLGLVYKIKVDGGKIDIDMTMTSPSCPYIPQMLADAKDIVSKVEGVSEVNIEVVWDPPWGPERVAEEVKLKLGLED